MKILIVEDEILLAQDISNRLTDFGYEVIGIAPSVAKAIELINTSTRIDIILVDIILKGNQDGITLANIINNNYRIPFIFLTSHADEILIQRAKLVNPAAYILKPFNDRQVQIAIELALLRSSEENPRKDITENKITKSKNTDAMQIKDSLFLKKDNHFERVPLKKILYLQADNSYSTVFTKTERFIYSMVLKKIEAVLPSNQFLRIHRSYVVNIQSVNGYEGNMLYVGSTKIPVSKAHKKHVFQLFHTI